MSSCDAPPEEGVQISWKLFLGVSMSIVASIVGNFGANMQKFSQMVEEERELPDDKEDGVRTKLQVCCAPSFRRPYPLLWRWWIGMFSAIGGALGDFAALALAPQSVCSPIGSTTLVANLFFATLWLKEKLRIIDLVGTLLVIVGAVVSVIFGSKTTRCYTESELKANFAQPLMITYLVVCWATILSAVVGTEVCNCLLRRENPFYKKWLVRFHAVIYSLLAGVMCAQSILFGKSIGSLLMLTMSGDNQLVHWFFWVMLACCAACLLLNVHFLNCALGAFDALFIIPAFQAIFITSSVAGGLIFYKEWEDFGVLSWICFPAGVCCCLIGVLILSGRSKGAEDGAKSGAAGKHAELVDDDDGEDGGEADVEAAAAASSASSPTAKPLTPGLLQRARTASVSVLPILESPIVRVPSAPLVVRLATRVKNTLSAVNEDVDGGVELATVGEDGSSSPTTPAPAARSPLSSADTRRVSTFGVIYAC
jgi:hypothetical protein